VAERNATVAGSVITPVAASRNTTTDVAVDSSTSEKVEATASGVGVVAESDDVVEPVPQPRTRQVPNYPYQQLKQMLMTFRFDQKKGSGVSEGRSLSKWAMPTLLSLKLTKATLEAKSS